MKITSAATLLAAFALRLPTGPGSVASVSASADEDEGQVETIQAMAVKGFAQVSGPLQYVKAKEHFYAAGEPIFAGDYVQLTQEEAKRLVAADRAELATEADVAAAESTEKGK